MFYHLPSYFKVARESNRIPSSHFCLFWGTGSHCIALSGLQLCRPGWFQIDTSLVLGLKGICRHVLPLCYSLREILFQSVEYLAVLREIGERNRSLSKSYLLVDKEMVSGEVKALQGEVRLELSPTPLPRSDPAPSLSKPCGSSRLASVHCALRAP